MLCKWMRSDWKELLSYYTVGLEHGEGEGYRLGTMLHTNKGGCSKAIRWCTGRTSWWEVGLGLKVARWCVLKVNSWQGSKG